MINNQAFYRSTGSVSGDINGDDARITDQALVVNCTGACVIPEAFVTENKSGRHDIYIMYMYNGALSAVINGKEENIVPGDIAVFPPNIPYRYEYDGNGDGIIYYWVHFTGSFAERLLELCLLKHYGIFNIGISENIVGIFKKMFGDFIRRDEVFELSAAARLQLLCTEIRRRLDERRIIPDGEENGFDTSANIKIYESLGYIHMNSRNEISVGELAELEHMSVSRYNTVFRECTGMSPMKYIIKLRMINACELLGNTDLSVKQVSSMVGYSDQLYFSRVFKNFTGQSPSVYRHSKNGIQNKE